MRKLTKKDLISAVVTGFTAGFIGWRLFGFLGTPRFFGINYVWLMVIMPVLWIIGVQLGYILSGWMKFFAQFGRYAAVGFTNFAVDLGILNLFIAFAGVESGLPYAISKTISATSASLHSYFWNKYWAFDAGNSEDSRKEFINFVIVVVLSIIINAVIATSLVSYVRPLGDLTPKTWKSVAAVIGSAVALIFGFIGFRFVFKPSSNIQIPDEPNPVQKIPPENL